MNSITLALVRSILLRLLVAGLIWIVLTGGSAYNWGFALLVIAAAVATSLFLMPAGEWRWTLPGLLRFLPFFLIKSVLGGIDVSIRAFNPRMPLQPGIITYELRIPEGAGRVFFANSVSLQPGSFVAGIEGDVLQVHALDTAMPISENLRELEDRVAQLFGVSLQ
jgi:multicomponent Na+:H+ antiporter subunit E